MILQILFTVLLGFCVLKVLSFFQNYLKRRSILKKTIKGPDDIFLLGNAHILESDPVKFHKQLLGFSETYFDEKAFRFWVGPQAYIVCHHPDTVEKVLASNVLINKANNYRFLYPWIGQGLLTASGEKWKRKRKALTPAFHFKILNDFIPIFNKNANIMSQIVASKLGETVDAFPLYTMAALDVIAETAMGVSIDAQSQSDSDYVKAILELSEDIMNRTKNPLLQSDLIFSLSSMGRRNAQSLQIVHSYSERVIRERKQNRKAKAQCLDKQDDGETEDSTMGSKKKRLAFLDLLLEYQEEKQSSQAPDQITDQDIREEVDTFMFEGHDTTAAATTWATYLLAKYTDEQRKLHEEMDEIFGDDKDRDITNDDIQKMTYLDQIIKEALRIYPSVPYIGRKVEKDFDLCGHIIPKGCDVIVLTFGLHYRRDIYPDPFVFKPERFSPSNRSQNRSPFAYVPFSAGPRNCIGAKFANMEEKVLLASIFRKYSVTTEILEEDLAPSSQLILRPSNPVNVKFARR